MAPLTEKAEGLVLKVFVQPKASKNRVSGLYGDALKIKLTAPPVEGAANRMCLKFIAKCLKVPPGSLELISGQTGRVKRILLRCDSETVGEKARADLKQRVAALLKGS